MSITITEFEKKTYYFINENGEIQVSNIPKIMGVQFLSSRMQG